MFVIFYNIMNLANVFIRNGLWYNKNFFFRAEGAKE